MARFNRQWLNHPSLNRLPKTDAEQREFVRVLLDALEGAVSNISDEGQITTQAALPATTVLNRASALVGSSTPITATDTGPFARVDIAAHTIQAGDIQISYDAGFINGLAYSTTYFIFASDPTLAGGGVTYQATTVPEDVVASDDNYYVGRVTTPAALDPAQYGSGGGAAGGGAGGSTPPGVNGIWP